MYVVSVRVKGPQGSITLPERGYRSEPDAKVLAGLDADARQQYYDIHSTPSNRQAVDLKVEQRRGSQTVSRDGQIVPKK